MDGNESKLDANGKFLKGPNYWKPDPKIKALLDERGVQARRPTIYSLERKLARLKVPLHVMTGDEDNNCLEPGVFIKRACASAWLTVVPNTGHAVNVEEPDLFNRVTAEFLAQVDSGRWRPRDPRSLIKSTMAKKS